MIECEVMKDLGRIYRALGGEEKLQEVLDQFYENMSRDILIGYFFTGKDLKKIASMQKSFLMRAWGITKSYAGKSPADAHKELPDILKGHFDRRLRILEETLEKFGLEKKEIKAWVEFESKFRKAVQSK